MDTGCWKTTWLTSWGEVWDTAFISQWRALIADAPNAHVFFEPSLVGAWVEAQIEKRIISPRFFLAEHESGTSILLPLVYDKSKWQEGWIRSLQPVGFNAFDYHDPIVAGNASNLLLEEFWYLLLYQCNGTFGREVDVVRIPFLSEKYNFSKQSPIETAPFLDLTHFASFDEYLGTLSSRWRQDIRYQTRRLKALGDLTLKVCDSTEKREALEIVDFLSEFHSGRWSYDNLSKPLAEIKRSWSIFIDHALSCGILQVTALLSCGVPVSCSLGFLRGKTYYHYIPAFSETMRVYSPGKIHLAWLIREAIEDGLEVFDLLRGDESYKSHWTKESKPLHCLERKSPNLQSKFRYFLKGAVASARSCARPLVHRYRVHRARG